MTQKTENPVFTSFDIACRVIRTFSGNITDFRPISEKGKDWWYSTNTEDFCFEKVSDLIQSSTKWLRDVNMDYRIDDELIQAMLNDGLRVSVEYWNDGSENKGEFKLNLDDSSDITEVISIKNEERPDDPDEPEDDDLKTYEYVYDKAYVARF